MTDEKLNEAVIDVLSDQWWDDRGGTVDHSEDFLCLSAYRQWIHEAPYGDDINNALANLKKSVYARLDEMRREGDARSEARMKEYCT